MTTICPECSHVYQLAPSKRVNPCPNCLSIEKTGESLKEIASQKQKEWKERSHIKAKEKEKQNPPKTYTIPKQSMKGAKQARAVTKTKHDLKRAAIDGGFGECEGCGNFFDALDCSHKVPLSQSHALASDPENIRLLCRVCHEAWEGNRTVAELIALKCFLPDIRYLFDNDKSRFYNFLDRILTEHFHRPTPKLERVLGKIEAFE